MFVTVYVMFTGRTRGGTGGHGTLLIEELKKKRAGGGVGRLGWSKLQHITYLYPYYSMCNKRNFDTRTLSPLGRFAPSQCPPPPVV